jgi:DNA modification methylase
MLKLLHGDCLELMKDIPDKSIDAIITDPPYGTTACKWDAIIPFEPMWKELNRIIKPNGTIVLFGSQPFTSVLLVSNLIGFSHRYGWVKSRPTGFQRANFAPLRSLEDILVFSTMVPINNMVSIDAIAKYKKELYRNFLLLGISMKQFNIKCGFEASGYFRMSSSWANVLPNGEKLSIILSLLNITNDDLPCLEQTKIKRTYNPQGVTACNKINNRASSGNNWSELSSNEYEQQLENYPTDVLKFASEGNPIHPTQKPVSLMEYLIKTYTNEGETVLDFTMGSGTTGVACKNLNRNFIGIEKDDNYFKIASDRINNNLVEQKQESML